MDRRSNTNPKPPEANLCNANQTNPGSEPEEGPRDQENASLAKRLVSFESWGQNQLQQPEKLARAGFVYKGSADIVKCFYCGLKLGQWEAGDDPFNEHRRFRPSCGFLRQLLNSSNKAVHG